jgi:Ca2+-binding RTX toxin-like protein
MAVITGTSKTGETLTGTSGNDTITGLEGQDTLRGEGGNDLLDGGGGLDLIDGGGDFDTLLYTSDLEGVIVDLSTNTTRFVNRQGVENLSNIENVTGSASADTMLGDNFANVLRGGLGNDSLDGGGGDDTLWGEGGDDTLNGGSGVNTASYEGAPAGVTVNLTTGVSSGGAGADTLKNIQNLLGSNFDDFLHGDAGPNRLDGGLFSDDSLWGHGGDDILDGNLGLDTARYDDAVAAVTVDLALGTATGGDGKDTLISIENVVGSAFADLLIGNDLANDLDGLDGADVIRGGLGNDRLFGQDGDDLLTGGAGDDRLDGGKGTDRADYFAVAGIVLADLSLGTVSSADGNDTLIGIESVSGSNTGDDRLTGDGNANVLEGWGGNDTLAGGAGADRLFGGEGGDTLVGGDGDDTLNGGLAGNSLDGGPGLDIADYQDASGPVTVTLAGGLGTGTGRTDTLTSIEGANGSGFDDILGGDANANVLSGFAGADRLTGGAGNDTLSGGDGADRLAGGPGNDALDGGAGIDLADYQGAAGGVVVNLVSGLASGGDGSDTLVGIENVNGSDFGDTLVGDGRLNELYGLGASDTLSGGAGADKLFGGDNDDVLSGDEDDDTLDGGAGVDTARYLTSLSAVIVSLVSGTASGGGGADKLLGIENLTGSGFDDTLTGDAGPNRLEGLAGNDILSGGDGNDLLIYGPGSNTLSGGAGFDTADYQAAISAIVVDIAAAAASGTDFKDAISGIEQVYGSAFGDTFVGDAGAERFLGLGGNDTLTGGAGDDLLDGGTGVDTVLYLTAPSAVVVDLATGKASGGGGSDTLIGIEQVSSGAYADTLTGDGAANALRAGDGNDVLVGAGGNDQLFGESGEDRLEGGSGDDSLDGGAGLDTAGLAGARAAFSVQKLGTTWKLIHTAAVPGADEGSDTLVSIERLSFSDKTFELVRPATTGTVGYGLVDHFLFDPVFYLLGHPELVPTHTLATAWDHYQSAGAASNHAPNTFFDAAYYANRWPDLRELNLDNSTLFRHYNLYGVWEGRSAGPKFDQFNGARYLTDNPDVAAYVDANVADFLGSRSNGAIAHFVIYGANEQRAAYDGAGQPIDMGYLL